MKIYRAQSAGRTPSRLAGGCGQNHPGAWVAYESLAQICQKVYTLPIFSMYMYNRRGWYAEIPVKATKTYDEQCARMVSQMKNSYLQRSPIRKRLIIVLICIGCCAQSMAFGSEYFLPPEGMEASLPFGIWSFSGDESWHFIFQSDVELTEAQQKAAEEAGILAQGNILPSGTTLTVKQLERLYPNANDMFGVPKRKPTLSMFELTGKWFYGSDDQLYYQHDDDSVIMTMDEVFAQLQSPKETNASDKIIYLTIDDSPSAYTMELLTVLDELDVKATFFVVGAYVRSRPVFLRAIYEQGHTIANHSYYHDEGALTRSYSSCLSDFRRTEEEVAKALGFTLDIPILRIPYGSSTIPISYLDQLTEEGYYWIDWNALNGDTESNITSDKESLQRAYTTANRYDGAVVMLVHDGKKRTIRTLPEMVAHFRELGYEFRVLDTSVPKIPGVRSGIPELQSE